VETNRSALEVRVARTDETEHVSNVLLEADAWLRGRGVPLWSVGELTPIGLLGDVRAGSYILALSSGAVVGVARCTDSDPVCWPDADPTLAWYLHRLAVRRAYAGGLVSRAIVDWATVHAAAAGRDYLRLDCDATRSRLCELYERLGFQFHSERGVGPHIVARYQKSVVNAAQILP
jgi:GNAT superfamily N-acetyltransferase